jgi:hypothetical protein
MIEFLLAGGDGAQVENSLVRSAAMKERANTLSSWISTAVGRCFGSVLMA